MSDDSLPARRRRRRPHRRAEKRARREAIEAGLIPPDPPPAPAAEPRTKRPEPRQPPSPRTSEAANKVSRVHVAPSQARILGLDPYDQLRVVAVRERSVVVVMPDGTRATLGRLDALPHTSTACDGCRLHSASVQPPPRATVPARPARRASSPRSAARPAARVVRRLDPTVITRPSPTMPDADEVYCELLDLVCGEDLPLVDALTRVAAVHDLSSADVERIVRPVVRREDAFDLLPLA